MPTECRIAGSVNVVHPTVLEQQGKSDVEFADYLRALRVRWRWVTAGLLLGVLGAVLVIVATTPVYQAGTELFVSTRQPSDGTDLYSGSSFSQQRVQSYTDIVTSPRVLDPVIGKLGLDESADELGRRITVNAPVDTVLLDITARDTDARRAAGIANAVSASFVSVVGQLESTGRSQSPVRISSVRQATVPVAPVLPNPPLTLVLGVVLGLIAGVVGAVVRQLTDRVVRDENDLSAVVSTTLIGEIPFDKHAAGNPTLLWQPHGERAEAFRALRTNLRFVEATGHLSSLVMTSSVAREGKTITAINLALAMMDSGLKVVIVDADLRRPRLAHYLGLIDAVGLTTVLVGAIGLTEALQRWGGDQLYVLTAGDTPPNPAEMLGSAGMVDLIAQLENDFDVVIFDAPPLLPVTDAAVLAANTSGAIMLASSGKVRRDEVVRAMRGLETAGARTVGTVLTWRLASLLARWRRRLLATDYAVARAAAGAVVAPAFAASRGWRIDERAGHRSICSVAGHHRTHGPP